MLVDIKFLIATNIKHVISHQSGNLIRGPGLVITRRDC